MKNSVMMMDLYRWIGIRMLHIKITVIYENSRRIFIEVFSCICVIEIFYEKYRKKVTEPTI
jgi:hypothetical protein